MAHIVAHVLLQSSSPGYGIVLVAETDAGRFVCAEQCVASAELLAARQAQTTPEDVGVQAACLLLNEIKRCVCMLRNLCHSVCETLFRLSSSL